MISFDPIAITYASFGQPAPKPETARRHLVLYVFSLLFVITGVGITVVFNTFTILAGVLVTFLGQKDTRFRFLFYFGRIPAIAINLPAMFGFALWHQGSQLGYIQVLSPFFGLWLLGWLCILVVAFWQRKQLTNREDY